MNTIRRLDHYRITVSDDKLAIEILARLYRDGPKTEDELHSLLNSHETELKRKLTQLYRANFIHLLSPDKWATTNLSEEVLAHMGIAQVAAKSLLAAQNLPQSDLLFLDACIEAKSNIDYHWSKQQTVLLQNLSRITDIIQKRLNQPQMDHDRIVYAIIVGLDPDIQLLGEEAYCDFIFKNQHNTTSTVIWQIDDDWKRSSIIKCSQAVKDVHESNKFLFHSESYTGQGSWETFFIAWARVLNALMTELGDSGLQSASRVTENAPALIWDSLKRWLSDIEDISFNILLKNGKLRFESKTVESKHDLLKVTLWNILRHQNETHNEAQCSMFPNAVNESPKSETSSTYPSLLIPILRHFNSELLAGKYDEISNEQKESILNMLNEVNIAFQERLIGTVTPTKTDE